jgi:hypothetical protein
MALRNALSLNSRDLEHPLDIVLDLGSRIDLARAQLHLLLQRLVLDPPIALEGELIDDRVLGHGHDQDRAFAADAHIAEQAGGEQAFERPVDALWVERLAGSDRHVGANRLGLDPLVTLDPDLFHDAAGKLGRGGHGQQQRRRPNTGQPKLGQARPQPLSPPTPKRC